MGCVLGRRGFLLVDFDDHKAIGFLDDAPAGTPAGCMPARDRPALRNVISTVLFFPGRVDHGIAVGGSALAASACGVSQPVVTLEAACRNDDGRAAALRPPRRP